jgi:uncharacterized membrane protein
MKRLSCIAPALLLAVAIVLTALPVIAQTTGGSFGGGDFSSGGGSESSGGGGDYGGSYGGSYGGDYGGYSGGYYSSGDGGSLGCGGTCCVGFVIAIVVVLMFIQQRRQQGQQWQGPPQAFPGQTLPMGGGGMPQAYMGPNAMYVTQISIGLDWRARATLQQQLMALAQRGDTRSPQGLANLLSETVLNLRRNEMSWLYASYRDGGVHAPQQAQGTFQQLANEARSRFRSELVRGTGGQVNVTDAPALQARADEGKGTVVVTIVLATRRPMQGWMTADANQIRTALADRGTITAQQMVALEVVWSPAAENDRMSTAELEQFYPEMKLIDPNSIAGRVFCAYCNGPFPAELLNCPHCGAPAEASKDRRTPPR